jgi:competence ComEA-like helix-hairpin-helix protein
MKNPRHLLSVLCVSTVMLASIPSYAAAPDPSCHFPININTADVKTFSCLPGVGEKMSNQIVTYRQQNGGSFKSLEDLKKIKGVSDKRFDSWKDKLTLASAK